MCVCVCVYVCACMQRRCRLGATDAVGRFKCPTKVLTFDSNLCPFVLQPGAPPASIQVLLIPKDPAQVQFSLWEFSVTFPAYSDHSSSQLFILAVIHMLS